MISISDPIVHVSARFPKGSFVKDGHSGSVDHIAWKASGAVDFRKKLKKLNIEFEEQNIENAGYQVFLYDPYPREGSQIKSPDDPDFWTIFTNKDDDFKSTYVVSKTK